MKTIRYHVGYWLMRAGVAVLPRGRVKAELFGLLDRWTSHVYATIDARKQ